MFGSLLSFNFDLKLMLPDIEAFQSDDRADRCVLRSLDVWMEHLAAVHEDVLYGRAHVNIGNIESGRGWQRSC